MEHYENQTSGRRAGEEGAAVPTAASPSQMHFHNAVPLFHLRFDSSNLALFFETSSSVCPTTRAYPTSTFFLLRPLQGHHFPAPAARSPCLTNSCPQLAAHVLTPWMLGDLRLRHNKDMLVTS